MKVFERYLEDRCRQQSKSASKELKFLPETWEDMEVQLEGQLQRNVRQRSAPTREDSDVQSEVS